MSPICLEAEPRVSVREEPPRPNAINPGYRTLQEFTTNGSFSSSPSCMYHFPVSLKEAFFFWIFPHIWLKSAVGSTNDILTTSSLWTERDITKDREQNWFMCRAILETHRVKVIWDSFRGGTPRLWYFIIYTSLKSSMGIISKIMAEKHWMKLKF